MIYRITRHWSSVRAVHKNGLYSWIIVMVFVWEKKTELPACFCRLLVAAMIDHTYPYQELTVLCSSMQWLKFLWQWHLCHFCWASFEFSTVGRWTCSPYNIVCFIYCFFHITLWDSHRVILWLSSCVGWPITVIKEFGMR